ncbi:hypothetical protein M0R45_017255 [Rubus argutus]|uniref:Uncharacterized protein n=1 Tax=Rubus argutus TaxID=59490 RepID=A0AAW1XUV4_RUBAR
MLRPAARHFCVVVGQVCLDIVCPWVALLGSLVYGGCGVGLAGLAVFDWFMPRAHWLYGGKIRVVFGCLISDVTLMLFEAECGGWAEVNGVGARSVLGGSQFNSDLTRFFGKGGVMVVEGRHGWGCDGSGGPLTVMMVLGIDQIVG